MAVSRLKNFVAARIRRCRAQLAENDWAALIVVNPRNVAYLTGFSGDDSVLVLTARDKVLVTDSRYTEQAHSDAASLKLHIRSGPMAPAVATTLSKPGIITEAKHRQAKPRLRIAIEADTITASQLKVYRKHIPGLYPADSPVTQLRLTKDDYEISQLRRAIRIAEQSFDALREHLKPGVTERELAARLNYEMVRRGAREPSFETIAAFGPNAALPHALPGAHRLKTRDTLLFDFGAAYAGYRSDLTRCLHTGRIRPDFAEAYRVVLDAQLAAIEAVKSGVALSEVDAAARVAWPDHLPAYGHGTGHGIGLDIHEAPVVSARSKDVLEPGMVITIEPGIYLPGRFGIRIEDDVMVTPRGAVVLSRLPKNLDSVRIA